MKLKRIIAGITACTIVGSTMLTMPISARTITKVEEVTLSDLMNTAKMVADLKDDLTAEKQAEILDRFDTDGSGHISIAELLEVAKRVARIDESDIVNEYGTADSEETTTAETTIETTETTVETSETTETTVETTETTEETTTTTEAVAFNPVIEIDGTEYKDGDTFAAKANKIYEVNATDAENEITVSLTGSKDDEDNDLVRVSENRFETVKDGTLTVTVKSADGQQKTITLDVKIKNSLEDADLSEIYLKYSFADSNYYSDDYKKFSNEVGKDIFNNSTDIEDPEQYWKDKDKNYRITNINNGVIEIGVGGKVEIKGFGTKADEDYDVNDKITYISTDANKVTIDENGVITGIVKGDTEIIVMANGKQISKFKVSVGDGTYSIIEPSDEKYAFNYTYSNYINSSSDADMDSHYEYKCLAQGKYIENASKGEALSLKDLQNQVGAENIKSVSVKKFDGTKREITNIDYIEGVMYYLDTTTSTVYYAITSETGQGEFRLIFENKDKVKMKVLDMEQYKKYQAEQAKAEAFTVEFYGKRVATATAGGTQYYYGSNSDLPYVYIAEGETFSLSDIVKVSGVNDPKITVTNSQNGTSAQNLEYDVLTKTFTALELTKENSGNANCEYIKLSYTASDGTTRTIEFRVIVAEPVFVRSYNTLRQRDDSGKFYCTAEQLESYLGMFNMPLYLVDADIDPVGLPYCKLTVDNKKMFSVTKTKYKYGSYDKLSLADGYEPKAGDTATITATASYMGDTMIFSPNLKVTYTIEVVDTLPEISRTLASDTFEYPEDNKSNQDVTFKNIVEIKNLKDGYKVVPFVTEASDNVGYTNSLGEYNLSGMTVDATGLELVEETNGRYSISGIQVASASKVREDTYIRFGLMVFDADGNYVSASGEPIYLYIKGEKPVEITFENTMSVVKIGGKTATYTIKDWDGYSNGATSAVKVTDENGTTIGTALVGDEILEVTFNKAVEKNEVRNFKIGIPVLKNASSSAIERTVTVSLTAENPLPAFEDTTVIEDNGSVTYTLKDSNGWKIKNIVWGGLFPYTPEISADGTSFAFTGYFSAYKKQGYNDIKITFEKNGVTTESINYDFIALKSPKIELENSVVEVDKNGTATFKVDNDNYYWAMDITKLEGQLKDLVIDRGNFKFSFTPELSAGKAKTYQIIVKMMQDGITKEKTFTITTFKAPKITLPYNGVIISEIDKSIKIQVAINGDDGWEITPSIDSSIGSIESFENGELTFKLETDFTDTKKMPITFSCSKQLDENTTLSATKEVVVMLTKTQTGEDSGDDVDGEDGGDISLS